MNWGDVSGTIAGAVVFVIGALVPRFVDTIEQWLNKEDKALQEPPATKK